MTTKCNLRCTYCYLADHDPNERVLDLDFAKRGISDYFASNVSRHVRFYAAGEPTLALDRIKNIRAFLRDSFGGAVTTELQTNGVFADDGDTGRWVAKNIDMVWVSIDGPPDIQDKERPRRGGGHSSSDIERNIRLMQNQRTGAMIGARSTITQSNLRRQVEMVEYFHRLGLCAVFSDPVFPRVASSAESASKSALSEDDMLVYAEGFLVARRRAIELGLFYGSILTVNFDEKTEYFCRSCLPAPHLTPDGTVTCCDMATSEHELPELTYGRFDARTASIHYDQSRIEDIRSRKASRLSECLGCEVLYNCAGACLGEGLNETGRLLGVKKTYCQAIRYLAKHMSLNTGLYPYLHP